MMLDWNGKTGLEGQARVYGHEAAALADVRIGMVAGTRVATVMGWRAVEAVAAGDEVLTFDAGMQRVVSVQRMTVWARETDPVALWPLQVPAGALGNREAMKLLADQPLLIESDTAEQVFGDPFTMMPASALDGFRGISRIVPPARIDVVILHFARDQVVFANVGALYFCPAATDALSVALAPGAADYAVMSREAAAVLISFLAIEDGGHVPVRRATAALAPVAA